ncbi:hypothetical protein KSS87_008722 [Heliosperma pusillum]|nr:hypothetical protein KSS87_016465 [Heliosperma pusillum]KAH9621143.1 hypothetical protein KSS87_008722 [Heliosperma pusillum]
MVKYELMITAELDNVSTLQLMDGLQDPNFRYFFKMQCEKCGLQTEKESWVCLNKQVFVPKSNRYVHLHQKCRGCEREGIIKMVPIPLQKDPEWRRWDEATPYTDYHGRKGLPVPLMKFECEGLEPFDFILKGPHWRVKSKSGIIFENVDLSGGDWAEWDEKMNAPVVITNFKWSLDVVKGWVWYGTRYWK